MRETEIEIFYKMNSIQLWHKCGRLLDNNNKRIQKMIGKRSEYEKDVKKQF